MSRVFHKRRSGGFTLLELLIALAVTAAVVALMFAGFGAIGRSEERNQRVMERSERMLANIGLLLILLMTIAMVAWL